MSNFRSKCRFIIDDNTGTGLQETTMRNYGPKSENLEERNSQTQIINKAES